MPPRNLHLILVTALVSLFCHAAYRNTRTASIVGEAIELIDSHYVDTVDRKELVMAAMQGVVERLDEHSSYFAIEEYANFQDSISQEFAGIGIYVEQPVPGAPVRVLTPLVGSPALESGMLPGDLIVEVDGEDVSTMPLADVSSRLKGPAGTIVGLTVKRVVDKPIANKQDATEDLSEFDEDKANDESISGDPAQLDASFEFESISMSVRRATIELESVLGDHRNESNQWVYRLKSHPEVAYVRLKSFGEKTVRELNDILVSLDNDFQAFVLDLRSNGGGLLYAARDVCDMFLNDGGIVSTRTRGNVIENAYSATPGTLVDVNCPVAVLIDENSASASEIVAACLQDNGRALIAGVRSYGKGTVQEVIPLQYSRSALRLTVARYFRPTNKNIHRKPDATADDEWGVTPDDGFIVPMDMDSLVKLNDAWRIASFPLLSGAPRMTESGADESTDEEPQSLSLGEGSGANSGVSDENLDPDRPAKPSALALENIQNGPEELVGDPPLRAAVGQLLRWKSSVKSPKPEDQGVGKLQRAG